LGGSQPDGKQCNIWRQIGKLIKSHQQQVGGIAQLAEHWIPNPKAIGSSPVTFMFLAKQVVLITSIDSQYFGHVSIRGGSGK
jgi:hypothetical protein